MAHLRVPPCVLERCCVYLFGVVYLFAVVSNDPCTAVSAQACWARAEAVGYVTLNEQGRVVMHDSKASGQAQAAVHSGGARQGLHSHAGETAGCVRHGASCIVITTQAARRTLLLHTQQIIASTTLHCGHLSGAQLPPVRRILVTALPCASCASAGGGVSGAQLPPV